LQENDTLTQELMPIVGYHLSSTTWLIICLMNV